MRRTYGSDLLKLHQNGSILKLRILIEFLRNGLYCRPDFNPVSNASKINRGAVGTIYILLD